MIDPIQLGEAGDLARLVQNLSWQPPAKRAADAATLAAHAKGLSADDHARLIEWLLDHARDNFMNRETGAAILLLRALSPTPAEHARFAAKLLALLETRFYQPSAAEAIGYAQQALLAADRAGTLTADAFTEVNDRVLNHPALSMTDYRTAGLVSRLAVGKAIDRGDLIRRTFTDLVSADPYPTEATHVLTALALAPEEHAGVTGDRIRLVERLLTVLLQEQNRKRTAASLEFLVALAPTVAEDARFTRQYLALLDVSSPVAGQAQQVLLGLDEAGLLDAGTFTEMCQRVLVRPEKKLVRAQLAALDRALGRDPARAAQLAVDAATAFQHPDLGLQENALAVAARCLAAAGGPVPPELRAAAEWLSPVLSAQAAELFAAPPGVAGEPPAIALFAETLPPVPEPRPVPGPAATVAEVAQEVAAVIAGDQEVAAFERALDGLVRHAHRDRAELAKALKPVMRRNLATDGDCCPADIYDVALAVRGEPARLFAVGGPVRCSSSYFSKPAALLAARLAEATQIIESGIQPFLLAVPTCATGALGASVLVERVAQLERAGTEPAPVDLAQALLRVTPTADERTLRAAGELRSVAGQRLAQWLRDGGLSHQDSEPKDWYRSGSWYAVEPARPGTALDPWFPGVAAALVGPDLSDMLQDPPAPFWVAQLPHHRDELAARDYTRRRRTRILPVIAEAGGPAGYAVHLALAEGLANRPHGDDPTVDALLVLAARGQLDSDLLGRQLETLLAGHWVAASRVADSLRAAAATGAYGTVWAVLAATLPGLLRGTQLREAGVLLPLAVECVAQCGAKGEIAEVTALADRGGSSQAVRNARLLRDALR